MYEYVHVYACKDGLACSMVSGLSPLPRVDSGLSFLFVSAALPRTMKLSSGWPTGAKQKLVETPFVSGVATSRA